LVAPIGGNAGDVLEYDLVGMLKVFVYKLPRRRCCETIRRASPHEFVLCSWDLYASISII